jgi:hypothetical protein
MAVWLHKAFIGLKKNTLSPNRLGSGINFEHNADVGQMGPFLKGPKQKGRQMPPLVDL